MREEHLFSSPKTGRAWRAGRSGSDYFRSETGWCILSKKFSILGIPTKCIIVFYMTRRGSLFQTAAERCFWRFNFNFCNLWLQIHSYVTYPLYHRPTVKVVFVLLKISCSIINIQFFCLIRIFKFMCTSVKRNLVAFPNFLVANAGLSASADANVLAK